MNSRTSFFNKSIFKSDIKRFWWTSLLEALVLYISTIMPVYERCTRYIEYDGIGYSYGQFAPDWLYHGGIVVLIPFVVGIAVILFSYVHFSASLSMHHSLPIKGSQLLCTKTITSLILTIVPILVNAIILGVIAINPEYRELIGVMSIVKWCLAGVLYTIVILALTVAVNLMTGHPVGALIFTVGFALLPTIIIIFLEGFLTEELFGYSGSNMAEILQYIYPHEEKLVTFPYWIVYVVMAVAFFTGAYFLYKHRKLENHGEVIAFSWLKPVFIGIVAMLASMLSWAYFNGVLAKNGVWWMIPLGVIGTIIAWMVSRKSLSLKGVHKPVGTYLAVTLLICIAVHFDATGFERRIPNINDIESVQFGRGIDYEGRYYYNDGYVDYVLKGGVDTAFTNSEDIKNVIALHEVIIKDRNDVRSGYVMPIEYTLKNGNKLTRRYNIDHYKLAQYLKPIYETPQMRAVEYNMVDGTEKEYISIEIQDRRFSMEERDTIYPDSPYMNKIIEAIQKDISMLTFEDMRVNQGSSIMIGVRYSDVVEYKTPVPENAKIHNDKYTHCNINSSFVNTLAVLDEMGYLDRIPQARDVEKLEISTWTGSEYPRSDKEYEVIATVTDYNTISAIYSEYDEMIEDRKYTNIETAKNIRIFYTLKSGRTFEVSCSYDEDKIPEIFKPYFE